MTTLARRAFLGARLAPDAEAFDARGVRIDGVVPGGMAAVAGLIAGDVVRSVAGLPVRTPAELGAALRRAGAGRDAELVFERDGAARTSAVPVVPCPREMIAGHRVEYGHLDVAGARLRTIVTRPEQGPPRAAVLWLQGIACESIDLGADTRSPLATLIRGWARAGVVTMRFDKRGVGDSEGGPCGEVDFATELADARIALAALRAEARADVPCFAFGHSVGGMIAALAGAGLDGLIVYGTSARGWLACVEASTRRQLALRGAAPEAIEAHLADLAARIDRDGLNGRSADYHRQLAAIDLAAAWRALEVARVLIVRGEHDWVVSAEEQEEIAALVGPRATLRDAPGLDHLLGWHPDRAASLRDYGAGVAAPALPELTRAWMLAPGV